MYSVNENSKNQHTHIHIHIHLQSIFHLLKQAIARKEKKGKNENPFTLKSRAHTVCTVCPSSGTPEPRSTPIFDSAEEKKTIKSTKPAPTRVHSCVHTSAPPSQGKGRKGKKKEKRKKTKKAHSKRPDTCARPRRVRPAVGQARLTKPWTSGRTNWTTVDLILVLV